MEKQQVSTFLKILQIPSNAPPEEIKESLLASGWNETDADEAITVLYPDRTAGAAATAAARDTSQIVAQRYVKQAASPAPDTAVDESTQATPSTSIPEPTAAAPSTSPETSSPASPVDSFAPTLPTDEAEVAVDTPLPEKAPIPTDLDPVAEKSRPHTDAPWLQQKADIYDITEEEKQEMIRTVYRTNERLSPQTIHALLGIDVDLSEYEAAYEKKKRGPETLGWTQVMIILLSSLAIASVALFLGLYYFEVGPFHPTITGGRG